MKKTSQPIKQKTLVGNIANQKYEASRNIERHIEIITNTQPTQETTRWKASQPYYFMKQEGRLVVEERLRNKDNQLFNQRLHQLATERREPDAREHAPGWRTGRGGVFIDCYSPSNRETVLEGMKKKQDFARYVFHRKRDKENVLILKFLESARSSYGREELRKKYERNRVAYNLFSTKTPHTALHLGLVKTAKERIERRNRMAALHYSAISAGTSSKSRPKSAPNVHKYDRQVLKAVDQIHDIHDFYELKEIDRQLRNRNGDWDSSMNGTNTARTHANRDSTIYSSNKTTPYKSVGYLNTAQTITEVMEEQARRQQSIEEREEAARKAAAIATHRIDLLDVPVELLRARPKTAEASIQQSKLGRSSSPIPTPEAGSPALSADAKGSRGSVDAMHKLGMLRKNVSFKELDAHGEALPASSYPSGQGGTSASPERRRSFLRQGSGNRLHCASADSEDKPFDRKRPGVKAMARSVSVISDLETDEDPTLPDHGRRKSLILDVHFEEDPETGVPYPCSNNFDTVSEPTYGGAADRPSSGQAVLQKMGIQLRSKFHLPVRCRSLEYPHYRPMPGDCPVEAVYISLFDVGYFLPGNEESLQTLSNLSPGPETTAASAAQRNGGEGLHPTSSAHRLTSLISRSASTDERFKRSPLGTPSQPSPGLREVKGLSLPTSVGLLVVVNDANPQSTISPAYIYLTVHQLLSSSLCGYADSLPRAVFGEMLSFSYPFGAEIPPSTPRDVNSFRLAREETQGTLCIDEDSGRAMVMPCLVDMMELEILLGFIEAVTKRLDVHWDDSLKQIEVRCP